MNDRPAGKYLFFNEQFSAFPVLYMAAGTYYAVSLLVLNPLNAKIV